MYNSFWDWFCRISLIIAIVIILNSIAGDISFRIKYSFPKVSATTNYAIDTSKETIQQDLNGKKYIKYQGENYPFVLNYLAKYSISGIVVAKNDNFWFRDIMRSKFDDLCLMDLGIVWGDLAADKDLLYKHLKFKSKKTLGQARQLSYRWDGYAPWGESYITSHVAHTHTIPANTNVMGALLKIKINDKVKLDGYLVDIYTDKSEIVARTSLSRSDNNATSRGKNGQNYGGACEVMYVNSVQIGQNIYK